MDERKFLILQAIIDDYITTAVPVGSRTISRKSGVGFSPATIRNEMSDLEELGYLDQPHTSAGRVPSAKAYRWYVDQLLSAGPLSKEDGDRISGHLSMRSQQLEQVIRRAAQTLSELTNYTSLVMVPQMQSMRIMRVHMVHVTETMALMIVVTNAGMIKDSLIRIPEGISGDILYKISNMLTEQLAGLTLDEIRQKFAEIFKDLRENRKLFASVLDALENRMAEGESEMVVGGGANLLHYPEYSDVEKARNFLSVLESKEKLYPLLRSAGTLEFSIRIGPENDLPELSECSLVTATYRIGEDTRGTMGIIGPTRMNYQRVISVLDFMGKALSDLLTKDK